MSFKKSSLREILYDDKIYYIKNRDYQIVKFANKFIIKHRNENSYVIKFIGKYFHIKGNCNNNHIQADLDDLNEKGIWVRHPNNTFVRFG